MLTFELAETDKRSIIVLLRPKNLQFLRRTNLIKSRWPQVRKKTMKKDFKTKYLLIIIFIIGLILFALTKFYFRKLNIENDSIKFILGIAPNFIATLIISISLLFDYDKIETEKLTQFDRKFKLILIGILILFIIEEYFPIFSNSKTTDLFDILASIIGLIIGYSIYSLIREKRLLVKTIE